MKNRFHRLLSCLLLCAALSGLLTMPASAASFSDVPAGHWAAEEIRRCVDLGFFKGQTATHFGLGEQMSRSAFAVVLCRFFGWDATATGLDFYADVPSDAWYAGAVEAACLHGALTGQSQRFRPTDPVTREEVAVALIRGLGYSSIAGLTQELQHPFTDVTTNTGYITMAYDLGVVNGTAADTFSPLRPATREQVAVMLIRLYDKLHAAAPELAGTVSGEPASVAVGVSPQDGLPLENAAILLPVSGSAAVLQSEPAEVAAILAEPAAAYDGLLLDIPQLSAKDADALTDLVRELRTVLGDKLLYVTAEAPSWHGAAYDGYDFAALDTLADKLVLRFAPYAEKADGVAVAPVDPLEEVYFALRTLKGAVPAEKLALQLTTSASVWSGTRQTDTLLGAQADALAAEDSYTPHYSSRYGCAYLVSNTNHSKTIWYLNGDAAAARMQMARFFGVGQVFLSHLEGVSADFLSGLR